MWSHTNLGRKALIKWDNLLALLALKQITIFDLNTVAIPFDSGFASETIKQDIQKQGYGFF